MSTLVLLAFWTLINNKVKINFKEVPVAFFTSVIHGIEEHERDRLFRRDKKYREFVMQHREMYRLHEFNLNGFIKIKTLPPGLERLSCRCRYNNLGDEGVKRLADSKNLRELKILDLGWNNITSEGAKYIATSENLQGLKSLNLRWNRLGDEGTKHIATSENLQGLTSLNLWGNNLGDEGVKYLATSENLRVLKSLDLRSNNLTSEGAKQLVDSKCLRGLTSLDLRHNNRITSEGKEYLTNSENLQKVKIYL